MSGEGRGCILSDACEYKLNLYLVYSQIRNAQIYTLTDANTADFSRTLI